MSRPLPLRANLEWLKKLSKERLDALRATNPAARLSEAQLEVAREFGFPSWRKLKVHIEELREKLDSVVPADVRKRAAADNVASDDPDLAKLLAAVSAGETQAATDLVAARPALAGAHGPEGETPLHGAAQCNDPQIAAILVAYGADVNAKLGKSGHSTLSWAVTCNAIECARTLVSLGAEADLFCAAGVGSLEHVQSHFDAAGELRPNASHTGSSRFAPDGLRLPCPPATSREKISDALYIACRNGQAEVVRFLLDKDPDLSFRAFLGATPLHWAYFGGSRAVVELLEKSAADAEARDNTLGCTPRSFGICVAANWDLAFLVRARLADDPSLVNIMDGRTSPLHEAARENHIQIVRLLLDQGANPRIVNGDGKTPLDLAIEKGHAEVAEMLGGAGGPPAN
ncbi:MAG TPA: ankyrin repeat domain-containing protein [Planctomycetaceae bacterium]|jgi:ankyrin repeat protein|nr:ankyrin repeat domain-containing protein [Planctomycetaceae bacterium]